MSVELRPLGVRCNIGCQYCYQNPQREAGNDRGGYDVDAMKSAIEAEGGPFTLFGGEPLLLPDSDLEELWSWGKEKYGHNTVQTNATLITEKHHRMFREHSVAVGVSIDGPGALNDVRWAGSLEQTRKATERAQVAIRELCAEGQPPSLIVTLHRGNATADKFAVMNRWMRELDALGVQHARLHLLEVDDDDVREKYALTIEENIAALDNFRLLEPELGALRFDLFADARALLTADDSTASCVWRACDAYTTEAVRGVEGHGQRSNCGRTNKEGIDFVKADEPGYERYLALYQTPQEHGGCQGCRFFLACKGQCPGTAIDGDWRNRTEHCGVWKHVFRVTEDQLLDDGKFPISAQPNRPHLEARMIEAWTAGQNPTLHDTIRQMWADVETTTHSQT